jgi:hypothetical protein
MRTVKTLSDFGTGKETFGLGRTGPTYSPTDANGVQPAAAAPGGPPAPPAAAGAAGPGGKPSKPETDPYKERLTKFIPGEVVGAYLACNSLTAGRAVGPKMKWLLFLVFLLGTPAHLWVMENVRKKSQLAISTGAYVIWVINIGGPVVVDPVFAGMLLIMYTFAVPMIHKHFDP